MSTNQFLRPFGSKRPEIERVQYINILIRSIRFIRLNSLFKTLSLHNHFTSIDDVDTLLVRNGDLAAIHVVDGLTGNSLDGADASSYLRQFCISRLCIRQHTEVSNQCLLVLSQFAVGIAGCINQGLAR